MHADTATPAVVETDLLILGAGLSGLSAAYYSTGKNFLVVERNDTPGGLCVTEERDGFLFDQTGHWLHMKDERTKKLVFSLFSEEELVSIVRDTYVFSHGVFTRYPFQANTFGLPTDIVKECVVGFAKAWKNDDKTRAKENFYEWCMAWFGEGISKHFMIPYNTKIYTVHPKKYASHWCDAYIPKPTIEEVVEGAISLPEQRKVGYNAVFYYPKSGGIGELPRRLFERCEQDKFLFNTEPRLIDSERKLVSLTNGMTIRYKKLISTIPLKEFLPLFADKNTGRFLAMTRRMKVASVSYLNVGLTHPPLHPGHWFYIPETRFLPYRVGSFSSIYPPLAPKGKGSLYVEFTHQGKLPISVEQFKTETVYLLSEMGLITDKTAIEFMDYRIIPNGYVIYHDDYFDDMKEVSELLSHASISLAGRYARWSYSAMENALLDGMRAAAPDS